MYILRYLHDIEDLKKYINPKIQNLDKKMDEILNEQILNPLKMHLSLIDDQKFEIESHIDKLEEIIQNLEIF